MSKILKLTHPHGSVDVSDVPVGRTYQRRKKILHKAFHIGTKY